MARHLAWIRPVLLLSVLCLLFAGCQADKQDDLEIARVGDIAVPYAEYQLLAQDAITQIYARFAQAHSAEVGNDAFWTQSYDGVRPADLLREEMTKVLQREKGIQLLAVAQEILPDAGYSAFLQSWEKENQARVEASRNGGALYGPVQYTQAQYYSQRQSTLEQALLDDAIARIQPTKQALLAYYKEIYPQESRKQFQAEVIVFSWSMDAAEANQVIAALQRALPLTDAVQAVATVQQELEIALTHVQRQLNTREQGKEESQDEKLFAAVRNTAVGGWTAMFTAEGKTQIAYVRALEYEAFNFAEQEDAIRQRYCQAEAERWLAEAVAAYPVVFNETGAMPWE